MITTSETLLTPLQLSVDDEALSLYRWWADHMVDAKDGGFNGEVDLEGKPVADAPKGVILNTRLLWYFSEIALHYKGPEAEPEAVVLAKRAFDYLTANFVDAAFGGLYWLLDAKGRVLDDKKQGYALAFGIYALSAYYRLTHDAAALGLAHELLRMIETRFWDASRGGYIEATARDGSEVADQRLSDKDSDCPKTMNTHLHILEAYTGLHQAAPDRRSEEALRRVISVFLEHFVNPDTGHLNLFFDMDWGNHTQAVSFGHDIEASWLLWEAAEALGDADLIAAARPVALKLAEVTLNEGLRLDGGLMYERGHDGHQDVDGEWWGQAEAMVGFLNAYQLSRRSEYFDAAEGLMAYIAREHKTVTEWSWYPKSSHRADPYLAGLWKCPYHNGRAMLELHRRLKNS